MKVVLIGRTAVLSSIGREVIARGHQVIALITAKESMETEQDREDIKAFCVSNGIPFFLAPRLDQMEEELNALGPIDVGLSINYVSVIRDTHINLFRLGILNAHGGDLPRYRGNACQSWAIMNGERSISLCIHRMVGDQLDAGDIIERESMPLTEETYIGDVYEWMTSKIPVMIVDAAEKLNLDSSFVLEKQSRNPQDSLRTFPRRPEDGRLVFTSSTSLILRQIRASSRPFAGAHAMCGDKKLIIWRASQITYPPICSIPGQVLEVSTDWFDISTEDGTKAIRVTEAIFEDGTDWRNSIKSVRHRLT
jgi:methionyl-tRNA formyltransferase